MNEADLIARAIAGEEAAERELFKSHVRRIYSLSYRMTGEPALADDCTQETFVRAFRALGSFRGGSAFATWLGRIALTVTLNRLRSTKRSREREVPLDQGETVGVGGHESCPFLRARIEQAVDSLPEEARTALILYDIEGYSHKEIAEMLSISEGVSKTRLSRARARLRVLLADLAEEATS